MAQDETALVLNDEAELKRQQAAERAQDRQDRLRDAYVSASPLPLQMCLAIAVVVLSDYEMDLFQEQVFSTYTITCKTFLGIILEPQTA